MYFTIMCNTTQLAIGNTTLSFRQQYIAFPPSSAGPVPMPRSIRPKWGRHFNNNLIQATSQQIGRVLFLGTKGRKPVVLGGVKRGVKNGCTFNTV